MRYFKTIQGEYEWRVDILEEIKHQFMYMVREHERVFFVRVTLKFPQGYPPVGQNVELSKLLHHLSEHYGYRGNGFAFVWVREQKEGSEVPHYHLIFFFDGRLTQDGRGVLIEAAKAWERIVLLTGYECVHLDWMDQRTGIMIRKPSLISQGEKLERERAEFTSSLLDALWRATYLAKTKTKGLAPLGIREFGSSRIPNDGKPLSFPAFFPASYPPYTPYIPPKQWGD